MPILKLYEHFFPVAGAKRNDKEGCPPFIIEQVCGTTFYIGNGFFLTAAHVIHNAVQYPMLGILHFEEPEWQFYSIQSYELFDSHDISILKTGFKPSEALKWDTLESPILDTVFTTGYPYAFEPDKNVINVRAFKGFISTQTINARLSSRARCYELSFSCPRGLSGAPLVCDQEPPVVKGVILGNGTSKMLVYSNTEIVEEKAEKTVYKTEEFDAMYYGIAIQTGSILSLKSPLLDMTLENHLTKEGLL